MQTELELIVRPTEIDVNGHVNNAKYLEYLEWGREEWYEAIGLSYEKFLELGIQTVTVNISINYRKECRQGERLKVVTRPDRVGRTSYVLDQQILNANGVAVADAKVTGVTMGVENRSGIPVPESLAKWF